MFGAVLGGGLKEGVGAEDIIGDGGEGISLEQGDVLEGGGVEDDLRAVEMEEFGEKSGVADAAEERDVGCAVEGAVDLIEGVFGGIKEDEAGGSSGCDGLYEGKADGASGAGDEDTSGCDVFAEAGGVLPGPVVEGLQEFVFVRRKVWCRLHVSINSDFCPV